MSASPAPLHGRVALVTGASRGIGLAIAQRLVADGARVVLTARKPEPLADAVSSFPAGTAVGIAGSADDPAHRADVFAHITELGRLDILIANAGINPVYGPLADLDLTAARKVLDVNVIGTLAWVQDAVRAGLGGQTTGGSIVALSSVTGQIASPGIGWYGVSKSAVSHLVRTLAVELAPAIRVNAIAPAVVKTKFAAALYEGREEVVAADYPLGRLGTPDDIAAAVAFLVSDDASWVTGQVLNLDGGLLAAGGRA